MGSLLEIDHDDILFMNIVFGDVVRVKLENEECERPADRAPWSVISGGTL